MVFFGSVQKRMKSGRLHIRAISLQPNVCRLNSRERSGTYLVVSAFSGFFTAYGRGDWVSNPMDVHTLTSSIIQGQVNLSCVSILTLND